MVMLWPPVFCCWVVMPSIRMSDVPLRLPSDMKSLALAPAFPYVPPGGWLHARGQKRQIRGRAAKERHAIHKLAIDDLPGRRIGRFQSFALLQC